MLLELASHIPPPRTVTDVSVNTTGLIVAGISVVSSGMQQLLCGVIQRKHQLQVRGCLRSAAASSNNRALVPPCPTS